jgi:hypothetical protein
MMLGAVALCIYSIVVCQLLMRGRWNALPASIVALLVWLGVAIGLHVLGLHLLSGASA